MKIESHSEGNSFDLLNQLESILERDALIDEVGFVHPSQFVTLNNGVDGSPSLSINGVGSADGIVSSNISDINVMKYDSTVFWNKDHKLAISTEALLPLYKAALHSYTISSRQYQMIVKLSVDESIAISSTDSEKNFLENEVMRHSKALLMLSYDFGSAWNSRKLVVSRKQSFSLHMEELHFSSLILSYAPKSEHAWSHRRWVIKVVAERYQNLPNILERESELVEKIAEQSKMNYRAWHHRCWLVSYMTRRQVLDELNQSRKWAELHIADNCCFHYRRRLMLRLLEDYLKQDPQTYFECESDLCAVWKEELNWNELLMKHYTAREVSSHSCFQCPCQLKSLGKPRVRRASRKFNWIFKFSICSHGYKTEPDHKIIGGLVQYVNCKIFKNQNRIWPNKTYFIFKF
ncbi:protein prenylyltransferase superfamily protein isoform X2 [Tasmannia lanceolata]|uniref:protein prenylyltransferase superfamily protein isoform X2 n=1 Tax=Tasmannia lanceolata TaxID=3420 RepID=UPI004064063C